MDKDKIKHELAKKLVEINDQYCKKIMDEVTRHNSVKELQESAKRHRIAPNELNVYAMSNLQKLTEEIKADQAARQPQ